MKSSILFLFLLHSASSIAAVPERDFKKDFDCKLNVRGKIVDLRMYSNAGDDIRSFDTVITFQEGAFLGTSIYNQNFQVRTFKTDAVDVKLTQSARAGMESYEIEFRNNYNKAVYHGICH